MSNKTLDQPKCLRCATELQEIPGLWKLDQVARGIDHDGNGKNLYPTGAFFTVRLRTCPLCGFVELFDKDL